MKILDVAKQVIKHQCEGLEALIDILDENFKSVVNAIFNTNGRIIVTGMGKSGHVAKKIAASMASTGTPSFFIHPAEASHGDLGMITEDDLVILLSNSGETAELQSILDYCIRFKITSVGISRNSDSTLAKSTTFSMNVPNIPESLGLPAPTTSSTMMLVLGDAIAITLMKMRDFSVDDFSILHPGGNLGARLRKAKDFMHIKNELPLAKIGKKALDAIDMMTKKKLGCLCVVDENKILRGFISDGDVRRNIQKINNGALVEDIMSSSPRFILEDEYLAKCVSVMNEKKITVLVVCNKKHHPIGLLHIHDLLRAGVV